MRDILKETPISFVAGIMNVPPQDIEDTIGSFASGIYFNVFWTDDDDFLREVAHVTKLNSIRSDSAVAERWGLREKELDNYVLSPSFLTTIGKFKDS